MTGRDVDLFGVLPLFRLNDGDGGFYLDKAAVVSRDPDDPATSASRTSASTASQVNGPDRLAIQPVPMHDVAKHLTGRRVTRRGPPDRHRTRQ